MTLDKRKFEWNLNTVISLITLAVMVGGWIYYWANTVRDIEELKQKWVEHDRVVETRLAENREVRGKQDTRIDTQEDKTDEMARKQDRLEYRVTVIETSLATQQAQQQKFGEDMSELKGDMKVIKEAVLRLDAAGKRLGR